MGFGYSSLRLRLVLFVFLVSFLLLCDLVLLDVDLFVVLNYLVLVFVCCDCMLCLLFLLLPGFGWVMFDLLVAVLR